MNSSNPYSPPKSEPSLVVERRSAKVPLALFTRWLISLVYVFIGASSIWYWVANWRRLADRAIIDPLQHPAPGLIIGLLALAIGIACFMRSKWSLVLVVAHLIGLIAYSLVILRGSPLPMIVVGNFVVEALVICFLLNELRAGRIA
jgi:peptidoglycan/LPS O-acetylase OafA/YrhL